MAKVCYRRISTNNKTQSVDRQMMGMTFDREYQDKVSGKSQDNRPEFLACMESLVKGDSIYFTDLSRCGRNSLELQTTVDELIKKGVTVHFLMENLKFVGADCVDERGTPPSPMEVAIGKMLMGIMSSINEMFLATTSENVKQGLKRAVAQGKKIGGSSPKHRTTFQKNKEAGLHKSYQKHTAAQLVRKKVADKAKEIIMLTNSDTPLTYDQLGSKLSLVGMRTSTGGVFGKGYMSKLCKEFEIVR